MEFQSQSKASAKDPADTQHAALPPPRFGLKMLFFIVTALAVGLAFWLAAGPLVGSACLLAVMVVFAHVAGNALGSQLRDRSARSTIEPPPTRPALPARAYAPVTKLSHRAPLGGFMVAATGIGAVMGAVAGGLLVVRLHPDAVTFGALAVGCLATAALGAFWAFWVGSLLQVFLGAWWQAHRHENTARRRIR